MSSTAVGEFPKHSLTVGGIEINIVCSKSLSSVKDVAVLFALHGRMGSSVDLDTIVQDIVKDVDARSKSLQDSDSSLPLVVISLDHRNHGRRLVDEKANLAWETAEKANEHNEQHALDMYSIQTGTARDVSFLIDFLPAYLFPSNEGRVVRWMITGISLGGHSTWLVLKNDSRVSLGVPIIGCPDYITLLTGRARQNSIPLPLTAPYFPQSLRAYVETHDPPSNPAAFHGKHILVLSGAQDPLVPWEASRAFVDALDVGPAGTKEVFLENGVGHECTKVMVSKLAEFVWKHELVGH